MVRVKIKIKKVTLIVIILLFIFARNTYAIDTKELMYTNDRSVYADSLNILNLWDEAYKIAIDTSKPIKERESARDRLVYFAEYTFVNFFEANTAVYAFPVMDNDYIMRVYEPVRHGPIVFMHKSSLTVR